jgi:hypothetical protein
VKDGWDAKMWKIAAMVLVLQVVASAAMTQAQGSVLDETGKFSGSYLCVPQAAGGVKWDENRKEWIGSSFKVEADDQLILKINAIERKE